MTDRDEARRGTIGGSDIAKAATGRYGGAVAVVAEKLGIDPAGGRIRPDLADRGHRWEHSIADGVHAHTGLYVGAEQVWARHPRNERYTVTPDGLLFDNPAPAIDQAVAGLEGKTRGAYAPWPWDYYSTQSQWGMYVTGLGRWLIAVATIDTEYDPATGHLAPEMITDVRYRWQYADEARQAALVELADRLLEHVDRGTLPDPDSPGALPYVKAANAEAGEGCPNCGTAGTVDDEPCVLCGGDGRLDVDVDIDDLADLIGRHEALKAAAKAAADELEISEARIRARMGKATEAHTTDGRWRVRCGAPVRRFTDTSAADFVDLYGDDHPDLLRTELDRTAAKAAMPDEYDALRIATTDRRLTIKDLTS